MISLRVHRTSTFMTELLCSYLREHNIKNNLMRGTRNSGKDCILLKANCKVLKSNFVKCVGKLMKSNSCEVSLLLHGRDTIDLASYRTARVNRSKIQVRSRKSSAFWTGLMGNMLYWYGCKCSRFESLWLVAYKCRYKLVLR